MRSHRINWVVGMPAIWMVLASATPLLAQAAAPSDLTAAAVSPNQINLTWRDNSSDELGFRIERRTGSNNTWVAAATVAANATDYRDGAVTPNTAYYYRVCSYNMAGDSNWSNLAWLWLGDNVELVGQIGGQCEAVYVVGNYAYVGEGPSLRILDVSNASTPIALGRVFLPDVVRDVFVSSNLAYVAASESGLQIIDVSNPSSPQLRGSFDTPGDARHVFVSGNLAYVADSISGLQIIDVSNPSLPQPRGFWDRSNCALGACRNTSEKSSGTEVGCVKWETMNG